MEVRKIYYPVKGTEKYSVSIGQKRYTCYLNPICGNIVCTGDGKSDDCKIITGTNLGAEIIVACSNWKRKIQTAKKTDTREIIPNDTDKAMFYNGVSWHDFI